MRPRVRVLARRLPSGEGLPLPTRATGHAAGFDLRAAVAADLTIPPGGRVLVPTGIALAIPEGFEGQVRPRSGLAWKHGITLPNAPGTIDADFRGEVSVILSNLSDAAFVVRRGDRIAQLVVHELPAVEIVEAGSLPDSARGDGGFGHTGER